MLSGAPGQVACRLHILLAETMRNHQTPSRQTRDPISSGKIQSVRNILKEWIVSLPRRTGLGLLALVLAVLMFNILPEVNVQRLPEFALPTVSSPQLEVTAESISSRPALINVWASWCVACRTEHDFLEMLGRTGSEVIYGLNHQDNREDAQRWLSYFGDPYRFSVYDEKGTLGRSMQIEVLPVTFLIGDQGVILARHDGPLGEDVFARKFAPLLEAVQEEAK